MKKQYFKLKVKLVLLVIAVLLISCGVLTYQKADNIRREYINQINQSLEFNDDITSKVKLNGETDDIVMQAYDAYFNVIRDPLVGFYSMLKDVDGNTLASDQYFMIINKNDEEQDRRVILFGENFFTNNEEFQIDYAAGGGFFVVRDEEGKITFADSSFSSVEIKGTCDDTFIYPEEIIFKDVSGEEYRYTPKEDKTDKGSIDFEEWAGRSSYKDGLGQDNNFFVFVNSVSFAYGDWEYQENLNAEAKEICEQVYDDIVNDRISQDYQSQEGLFTSYVGSVGYLDGEYYMPYIFVFHPLSIAVDELTSIYIGAALLGIVIIVILCTLINKIYKQQLAYEMNGRELTRGIAHELKTPLAITKGYVENWKYMEEQDKEKNSQTIIDEIEHMNSMVMDLLELSRLEAKAKEMNLESVDVHSLTISVLGRVKEMISEKGLQVTITPEEGEFLVNADLEMMRTVLVNLVTNAVKYSEKSIDIVISENAKNIKFIIVNDGKTIETNKLMKVWDEFYREGYTNNHHMGSSGLGLAITKNILILHKAKYGCKSQNGKTEFWFEMKK